MSKESAISKEIYRKMNRLSEEEQDQIYSLIEPMLNRKTTGHRCDFQQIIQLKDKGEKKIIAIDFDGVLHRYDGNWQGPLIINGGPYKDAFQFLEKIVHSEDMVAVIFSTRTKYDGSKEAISDWMLKHGCPEDIVQRLYFTGLKPPFHILIDDCAFPFEGLFPDMEVLRSFKPHWMN